MVNLKFKVIIAGTRTFNDYGLLQKTMDRLLANTPFNAIEIVSGTANGADKLGERYAKECGLALKQFPADWNTLGKQAGYVRNKQMAEYAEACVVFWDGKSKGTQHMINLAKEHGLKLRVIKYGE
jgi:hypothetical protein